MFGSAKQKIERAEYHISDLERQFAAFVAEKPHQFVVHSDPDTGDLILRARFGKPLPGNIALIVGDAIHNLRCAMDHAAWAIVGLDNGTQDRHLKFPTGDTRINFEASCRGIVTPSQRVKDAFIATEAFLGGKGTDLYEVHCFDNADKHTVITPVLKATGHPPLTVTTASGGIIRMAGNLIIGGGDEGTNLGRFVRGSAVELDNDAECPPSIFMGKANGRFEPAIPMLKGLHRAVVEAIDSVQRAVPA